MFDGFRRHTAGEVRPLPWGMTEYSAAAQSLYQGAVFPPAVLQDGPWRDRVARRPCTNLRIAETEKYAHVTFFFPIGGEEKVFERRRSAFLVPSPKVATLRSQARR